MSVCVFIYCISTQRLEQFLCVQVYPTEEDICCMDPQDVERVASCEFKKCFFFLCCSKNLQSGFSTL